MGLFESWATFFVGCYERCMGNILPDTMTHHAAALLGITIVPCALFLTAICSEQKWLRLNAIANVLADDFGGGLGSDYKIPKHADGSKDFKTDFVY